MTINHHKQKWHISDYISDYISIEDWHGENTERKLENKVPMHKAILKPMWTYDIQLPSKHSNFIKPQNSSKIAK